MLGRRFGVTTLVKGQTAVRVNCIGSPSSDDGLGGSYAGLDWNLSVRVRFRDRVQRGVLLVAACASAAVVAAAGFCVEFVVRRDTGL